MEYRISETHFDCRKQTQNDQRWTVKQAETKSPKSVISDLITGCHAKERGEGGSKG